MNHSGDDTVPEQRFDNDLSDIPLYLREARVKGLEIIKREKANKLAKHGRERQRSGESRRERASESSGPGRRDTGSSTHSTTASNTDTTDPPTSGGDHGMDTGSESDVADSDKTITDQFRPDPSSDLDNTMDVADETEQTEADDEQMPPSGTVAQSSSTTNDNSDSESSVVSQSTLSPESFSRRGHPRAAKFINRSLNENDLAKHQVESSIDSHLIQLSQPTQPNRRSQYKSNSRKTPQELATKHRQANVQKLHQKAVMRGRCATGILDDLLTEIHGASTSSSSNPAQSEDTAASIAMPPPLQSTATGNGPEKRV